MVLPLVLSLTKKGAPLPTKEAVYLRGFPSPIPFIVILEEIIALTQGLNTSKGQQVGIYLELGFYQFHTAYGYDFLKEPFIQSPRDPPC